jgi:mono/diheme cytochrome c family protein
VREPVRVTGDPGSPTAVSRRPSRFHIVPVRQYAIGLVVGLLVLPVMVLLGGLLGLFPTSGTATPSAFETAFARHALHAAVARQAASLHDPVQRTEMTLRAGMKRYRDNCAGCHGTPDRPTDGIALYPMPPQFALHTPKLSVEQLFCIVKNGVRYSGMFAFGDTAPKSDSAARANDEMLWTIVTFLHSLDSLPPAVAADWRVTRM